MTRERTRDDENNAIAAGILITAGQGLIGLGVSFAIIPTTPLIAPILGGALISSAWKAGKYLLYTPTGNITLSDYTKAEFIGAVEGATGGVTGYILGPVSLFDNIYSGAAGGAIKTITGAAAQKCAYPDQAFDLSTAKIEEAMRDGALAGGGKYFLSEAWKSAKSNFFSFFGSDEAAKSATNAVTVKLGPMRPIENWKSSAASVSNKRSITTLFESDTSPVVKRIKLDPSSVSYKNSM